MPSTVRGGERWGLPGDGKKHFLVPVEEVSREMSEERVTINQDRDKRIVGWYMTNNLKTDLALDVLNMAIYTRRPQPGLIHHSDRDSQYTSVEFGKVALKRPDSCGRWALWPAPTTTRWPRVSSRLSTGADPPSLVTEPTNRKDGNLRVHRGLLQHQTQALSTEASEPLRVRGG
jgi:hypothetical protein